MPETLDAVLAAARANPGRAIFISRTGVENQRDLAIWIAWQLKSRGYLPILQDAHFKHSDFLLAMNGALDSGARVLALVSREYLASQYCMKEATAAMDDMRNSTGRLILFNIDDCQPRGILRYVDRVRFYPVWCTENAAEMARVIFTALESPADLDTAYVVPASVDRAQRIHPEVLMHDEDAFTGRDADLERLRATLWSSQTGSAALTRAGGAAGPLDEATLAGMAGIGKTTLARAYAFRSLGDYEGVWWVRAEDESTLIEDLIEFGKPEIPNLERWDDRAAAAREALGLVSARKPDKPWLFVYDNAPGPGAVQAWRPRGNAHVLVTSRNPNWTEAVPLDVFTPEAAVEFLCETAARKGDADRAEAAALARQLGYLPLALAHAASKCKGNRRLSFADYGRRLHEFWEDRPDKRSVHGRSYPASVFGTFTLALEDILAGDAAEERPPCPEAETVMGVLALLAPEQVPDFLLWPLHHGQHAVMDEDGFDRALEELHQAGLIAWGEFEDGAPHLGVHRIVQDVMGERGATAGRGGEEFSVLAVKAVESSYDDRDSFASIVRNARWLPQAQAVLAHAPQAGKASWHTLWTQFQIGDLNVQRGSLGLAIAAYRAGQGLAERLAQSDPSNAGWQRDLSVSQEKIGDVLRAQGNLGEALGSYRQSLAVRERLAQSDPSNAGWQRDLSVSQEKIGDVLLDQGNLGEALGSYRQSLAVAERLAQSDPSNAGWQRDLSVSHNKIGDVLRAQGNLGDALGSYRQSLAVRERLAQSDPSNAGWQRDLSFSLTRMAEFCRDRGEIPEGIRYAERSLAIDEKLAALDPTNVTWQKDVKVSRAMMAKLRASGSGAT